VTGGPWRTLPGGGLSREAGGWRMDVTPTEDGARWTLIWNGDDMLHGSYVGEHRFASVELGVEAADLWAPENGYPAVRVEVDP
jgi:hypothetical protein